jgi:hypothetical protein
MISELQIQSSRLKTVFSQKTQEFMNATLHLLGYEMEMVADRQFRLRSLYSEVLSFFLTIIFIFQLLSCFFYKCRDDFFLFECCKNDGKYQLLSTPFATRMQQAVDTFLVKCDSIPAFLADLTLSLFGNRTYIPHE